MQYNNTVDKNGIIQDVERKINMGEGWISNSTDRLREFASYANNTSSRIWHKIWDFYSGWQYDDGSNMPQAKSDLVSGQSNYLLPNEALTVKRIEVYDENGNAKQLEPLTAEEIETTLDGLSDGTPDYYRLVGKVIQFYPTPNYTTTGNSGYKVYFDRAGVDFNYDDTTVEPSFAKPYHEALSLGMAIAWLKIKEPNSNTMMGYLADYNRIMEEIADFYSERFEAKTPIINQKTVSFE